MADLDVVENVVGISDVVFADRFPHILPRKVGFSVSYQVEELIYFFVFFGIGISLGNPVELILCLHEGLKFRATQ